MDADQNPLSLNSLGAKCTPNGNIHSTDVAHESWFKTDISEYNWKILYPKASKIMKLDNLKTCILKSRDSES